MFRLLYIPCLLYPEAIIPSWACGMRHSTLYAFSEYIHIYVCFAYTWLLAVNGAQVIHFCPWSGHALSQFRPMAPCSANSMVV